MYVDNGPPLNRIKYYGIHDPKCDVDERFKFQMAQQHKKVSLSKVVGGGSKKRDQRRNR